MTGSRWPLVIAAAAIFAIAALNSFAWVITRQLADWNKQNLYGAQLACERLRHAEDGKFPQGMDLQDVLDTSDLELINPYSGQPVRYVPFGDNPSPGDLTGFIADCVAIHTVGPGYPTQTAIIPNAGYYLFMYGAPGKPGLDVNWDGRGDFIAGRLQTPPIFGIVAGGESRFKPLDLVFDEHGIQHGLAPDTPGQCAWGKPCVETEEWCPICDGEVIAVAPAPE